MSVDLKALKEAFAPVVQGFYREANVDLNGTNIAIRTLTAKEELEAMSVVRDLVGDDEGEGVLNIRVAEYFDVMRRNTLAYAIVAVGDLDLRNETSAKTGEVMSNGIEVKIPKHKALLPLLEGLPRPVFNKLFFAYTELEASLLIDVNEKVVDDASNLDAEIERVSDLLKKLKDKKTLQQGSDIGMIASHIGLRPEESVESEPEPVEVSPEPPLQTVRKGPISPQEAPPPPGRSQTPPRQQEGVEGSFLSSDRGVPEQLAEEERRIVEMRRAVQPAHNPQPSLSEEDFDDGTPVVRMPSVSLDASEAPKPQSLALDAPHAGTRNPRFRPRTP